MKNVMMSLMLACFFCVGAFAEENTATSNASVARVHDSFLRTVGIVPNSMEIIDSEKGGPIGGRTLWRATLRFNIIERNSCMGNYQGLNERGPNRYVAVYKGFLNQRCAARFGITPIQQRIVIATNADQTADLEVNGSTYKVSVIKVKVEEEGKEKEKDQLKLTPEKLVHNETASRNFNARSVVKYCQCKTDSIVLETYKLMLVILNAETGQEFRKTLSRNIPDIWSCERAASSNPACR